MLGFRYRVHAMAHRKKLGSTLFRKVFRNVFRNARHTSRPSIAMYTSFDCSCSFSFYGTEVLELKVGSPSTSSGKRQERSRTPPRSVAVGRPLSAAPPGAAGLDVASLSRVRLYG